MTAYNSSTLLDAGSTRTSNGMLHVFKRICGGNDHRKRNFTPRLGSVNYNYATYNILHTTPQESTRAAVLTF